MFLLFLLPFSIPRSNQSRRKEIRADQDLGIEAGRGIENGRRKRRNIGAGAEAEVMKKEGIGGIEAGIEKIKEKTGIEEIVAGVEIGKTKEEIGVEVMKDVIAAIHRTE